MPAAYKSLFIELGLKDDNILSELEKVDKEIRKTTGYLNTLKKSLKLEWDDSKFSRAQNLAQKQLDETTKKADLLKDAIRKADEQGVDKASKEYKDLQKELDKTELAAQKAKKQLEEINNLKFDHIAEQVDKVGKKLEGMGKKFAPVSAAATAGLAVATKAAIDYEQAFTGVAKTVDATDEQLNQMREDLLKMSTETPVSANELANLAMVAGQLGIKTENVLDFTKTIADLGVASNLAGEDGAAMLAKFANITQMPQTDFKKLASTIVDLGNNSATSERDIMNMAMRLAGAATEAKISQANIMGISAALSSVGIEAEMGGTAMSKLINMINVAVATGSADLNKFAEVAGTTADEFKKKFSEDAAGALTDFLKGLGSGGENAIVILGEMGITQERLRDTVLRMKNAGDLLGDSIARSNTAWKENVALTNEAERAYGTTASQLELAKNELTKAAVEMGQMLLPTIRDLAFNVRDVVKWFSNLSDGSKKTILRIMEITAVIAPLLMGLGKLTSGIGKLIPIGGKLVTKYKELTAAQTALSAVMNANPFIAVVTAAVALTGAIVALKKAEEEAEKQFFNLGDAIEETRERVDKAFATFDETDAATSRLEELNSIISAGTAPAEELAAAEAERAGVEKWIIDNYGEYISAEEQKNGIRQDTLELLKDMTAEERERYRLELENSLLTEKNRIPELQQEIEVLRARNAEIEQTLLNLAEQKNGLLQISNEWQNVAKSGKSAAEQEKALAELVEKAKELTGLDFSGSGLSGILAAIDSLTDEYSSLNAELDKNKEKITDGNQSIEEYEKSLQRLIELNIGHTFEEMNDGAAAVRNGFAELNKQGKVSDETFQKLTKLFPQLNDYKNRPDALKAAMGLLADEMQSADKQARNLGAAITNIPNSKNIKVSIQAVVEEIRQKAQAATAGAKEKLTGRAGGVKNSPAGFGVVNDGNGKELIKGRDGSFRIMDSSPAVTYLEQGDTVYTAEETKKIMSGAVLPHFASGTKNEVFEARKSDFSHLQRTSEISTAQMLAWWQAVLSDFSSDAEIVKNAEEEIYNLNKKLADEAEKERAERFKKYKDEIEERERLDERWNEREREYGRITANDELAALRERAERYRQYADDVLNITDATEAEKAELRKKYIEQAEDLELEFFKTEKKIKEEAVELAKEEYREKLDFLSEYVEARKDLIAKRLDEERRNIEALKNAEINRYNTAIEKEKELLQSKIDAINKADEIAEEKDKIELLKKEIAEAQTLAELSRDEDERHQLELSIIRKNNEIAKIEAERLKKNQIEEIELQIKQLDEIAAQQAAAAEERAQAATRRAAAEARRARRENNTYAEQAAAGLYKTYYDNSTATTTYDNRSGTVVISGASVSSAQIANAMNKILSK